MKGLWPNTYSGMMCFWPNIRNVMKTCSKCKIEKDVNEFSTNGSTVLASGDVVIYRKSNCKNCNTSKVNGVQRSNKRAYLVNKWSHIKQRCTDKKRKTYQGVAYVARDEFVNWAIGRSDFNSLYDSWAKSGFNLQDSASIDRIDNNGDYELSNMQFIPFHINSVKDKRKRIDIISPSGVEHSEVGIGDFCAKHGIPYSMMYRLRKGIIDNYKGWVMP